MEFDTRPRFHRAHKFDRLVYGERPPLSAIDEVVVNPVAANMLHGSQKQLTTEDAILDHTFLMVPPGMGEVALFTPQSWTRTVTIDTGAYYYGNFVGNILSGKGCTFTGQDYLRKDIKDYADPWGYFGHTDAAKDMLFSNLLLQAGARVALPLGYVIINNVKIKEWMKQKWGNTLRYSGRSNNLDTVTRNGDHMAYYLRIGGSRQRLHSRLKPRHFIQEMQRIAPYMLQEMELNSGLKSKEIVSFFDNVINSNLTHKDFLGLVSWATRIVAQNIHALHKLHKQGQGYDLLDEQMSVDKDICLALFHQDFEEVKQVKTLKAHIYPFSSYEYRMRQIVQDFANNAYIAYTGTSTTYEYKRKLEDQFNTEIQQLTM